MDCKSMSTHVLQPRCGGSVCSITPPSTKCAAATSCVNSVIHCNKQVSPDGTPSECMPPSLLYLHICTQPMAHSSDMNVNYYTTIKMLNVKN